MGGAWRKEFEILLQFGKTGIMKRRFGSLNNLDNGEIKVATDTILKELHSYFEFIYSSNCSHDDIETASQFPFWPEHSKIVPE